MRRFIPLLLLLNQIVLAGTPSNLFTLPENRIDIGREALTLAKEIYPEISVAVYSAKIDALARQVRRLAKESKDPDYRVRCLNTVLLQMEKFQANRESSFNRLPDLYFLNRVLDSKKGNCLSMPLLYVAVGQRLGWPLYLVHVPDHSFVRYVDAAFKEANIETTSRGGYVPDEKYAIDFHVSETGRKTGVYLRTLTYRETLADLLTTNAVTWGKRGNLPKAIAELEEALKLNPTLVDAWANLESATRLMASHTSDLEADAFLQKAETCKNKLVELGFVHPRDVPPFAENGESKK